MCGRYALAYPPREVGRRLIEDGMPVDEAPDDEHVQPGYNIAPGHMEPVYRAVPGAQGDARSGGEGMRYVLEAMKWGLVPSWTKRSPDYGSFPKTINCRDDSLFENKGMWTSMKHRKRCIVVAQGFYEWLKKGTEKIPHFVKRKDGKLLCMAGLWDCVQYEGTTEKLYTYTVITTTANKQLSFLHSRMPVILENGSDDIRAWLDPSTTWNTTLQSLLQPYLLELEVYPVVKDVGNVRNNSPTFIIPLDSKDNKANIKNFFTAPKPEGSKTGSTPTKRAWGDFKGDVDTDTPPSKTVKTEDSTTSAPRIRSATSILANKRSPSAKKIVKQDQTPRITNFFTK